MLREELKGPEAPLTTKSPARAGWGGLSKGEWGRGNCMVHLGCQVWVDEKLGVLMKPQLYTLQNWEGWGWKPLLLASVAHTVSIPYQVHQTSFPALTQESTPLTSACTAQLSILKIHPSLRGSKAIKKGLQEPDFYPPSLQWLWKTPSPEKKKIITWISNLYWESLSTII